VVTCSQAIVFFASFSAISFASEEMSVMNSTQHSINRSLVSRAKDTPESFARISLMIFWTVALGRERSSFPTNYNLSISGLGDLVCTGAASLKTRQALCTTRARFYNILKSWYARHTAYAWVAVAILFLKAQTRLTLNLVLKERKSAHGSLAKIVSRTMVDFFLGKCARSSFP
jgi:hypothetical protein